MNAPDALPPETERRLQRVLDALRENEATADQLAWLDELVCRDVAACRQVVRYMHLVGNLQWNAAMVRATAPPAPSASPAESGASPAPAWPLWRVAVGFVNQPRVFALVFASVFLVAGLTGLRIIPLGIFEQPAERIVAPHLAAAPARLTGQTQCVWASDSAAPTLGPLGEGARLELRAGVAEIAFDAGAVVYLRGPAEFTVEDARTGFLRQGLLRARAKAGSQFTIRSPRLRVVDLGTEFGVRVAADGQTEVHVFAGQVTAEAVTAGAQRDAGEPLMLAAGQAAVLDGASTQLRRAASDAAQFTIPRLPTPGGDDDRALVAWWRFEEETPRELADRKTLSDLIADASGNGRPLDYWPGDVGPFPASGEVPPDSMFRPGHSGGHGSFGSARLAATPAGVLFFDAAAHDGHPFAFMGDFTLEGFFKTDQDQAAAGEMMILLQNKQQAAYWISLNDAGAGQLTFTLSGVANFEPVRLAVALAERNFADGRWYYFAARYRAETATQAGALTLATVDEDGVGHHAETLAPLGFLLAPTSDDMFIGRRSHLAPAQSHFRGWLDELRVHRAAVADEQLLGRLPPGVTLDSSAESPAAP